ncbi:S1/P1 nuclease [Blastopirellula marina]|nr:S1/P1 nuclease [Blastopirellula marina]
MVAAQPLSCFAWGSGGHRIAAIIAWRTMKPETKVKIAQMLRKHPRLHDEFQIPQSVSAEGKEAENEWLFAQATIWPDLIRGNKQFDHPTWHYIDLPLYLTDGDRAVMREHMTVNLAATLPQSPENAELNAVQAIAFAVQMVKGNSPHANKAIYLSWINHLVTDLSQPCHTTALYSRLTFPDPVGDMGGNSIPVNPEKNLHAYWDGLLGWEIGYDEAQDHASDLLRKFEQQRDQDILELNAMKWAEEGFGFAKQYVYCDDILKAAYEKEVGNTQKIETVQLSEQYQKESSQFAERQVAKAGFRLAALLDQALAD